MALFTTDLRRLMPAPRNFRFLPLFALAALVLTTGCSRKLAARHLRANIVASVGNSELDRATMVRWLKAAPTPPTEASAGLLVSTWIDQTELAAALQDKVDLNDTTIALQVIAPDATRGVLNNFWRARASQRPPVSDRSVDSLAVRDEVRVFQHLFISGEKATDSASRAAVVSRMRVVLNRLKAGESFTKLVKELSEDTATVKNDGYLPAVEKNDLPDQLRGVAWSLEPNEVSTTQISRIGLHLLRRATAAEAREGLRAWLVPRFGLVADTRFVDSIAKAKNLTFAKDAIARARAIAPEPMEIADSSMIATWTGGSLSPKQLRTWIGMLGPVERVGLAGASDSSTFLFVRETAIRQMLIEMISPKGPNTEEARASLLPAYHTVLDSALANVRSLSDKSPGAAAVEIEDGLLRKERRYRPLPGALPVVLRDRLPALVDQELIRKIIEEVGPEYAKLHANDSTAALPLPTGTPKSGPPIKP